MPAPKTRGPSRRRRNRAGVTEVLHVGSEAPSRANAGQQHPLLVTGCHYTHIHTHTHTHTYTTHTDTQTHTHYTHTQTHTDTQTQTHTHYTYTQTHRHTHIHRHTHTHTQTLHTHTHRHTTHTHRHTHTDTTHRHTHTTHTLHTQTRTPGTGHAGHLSPRPHGSLRPEEVPFLSWHMGPEKPPAQGLRGVPESSWSPSRACGVGTGCSRQTPAT